MLQACFLYGAFFFGTLAAVFFTSGVSTQGDPFSEMIQVILFVLTYAQNNNPTLPAALASSSALTTTVVHGFLSWQMLVLFLIIACFCLLAAVASAYTKALVLGVIGDAAKHQKTKFMDFWRNGRKYWPATIRYYFPFAILGALFIAAAIPITSYTLGKYIIAGAISPKLPAIIYILITIAAIAFLLRIFTLFADPLIIAGSNKPVRDSIAFTFRHFGFSIITAVILLVVTVFMFLVNFGLDYVASFGFALAANITWILLVAIWRVWVASYVVSRGQRRTQA